MQIQTSDTLKSDVNRLLKALNFEEPDRLPHLELWVTNKDVYEYVLERKLDYTIEGAEAGGQSITPEDDVEFAQRLGQDAVLCNFNWRPNNVFMETEDGDSHYINGTIKSEADLADLEPPTPIEVQLRHLERYLIAAEGTGVGIIPNFTSFFDSALLAIGVTDGLMMFYENRALLDKLMDILLEHQTKVVQAVCDRYGNDIAFAMVNDDVGFKSGLMIHPDMFLEVFPHRMKQLIAPVKALGKLMLMHTDGKMEHIMPILHDVGININHPIEPECNDIYEVKQEWAGRMALIGNIHTPLLAYGTKEAIEAEVRDYCVRMAPGGGYVLGSSTSIMEGIPPENFVAMVEAVHKYGRYGSLGEA